jgi:hypothetical protein
MWGGFGPLTPNTRRYIYLLRVPPALCESIYTRALCGAPFLKGPTHPKFEFLDSFLFSFFGAGGYKVIEGYI